MKQIIKDIYRVKYVTPEAGGVNVISLGFLTILLTISDFFMIEKYLKIKKERKLYVLFAIKTIVNILSYILLMWKYSNTVYSYSMLCFISLLSLISIEDVCSMKIDKFLSLALLVIGMITSFFVPGGSFWKIIIFAGIIAMVMYLFSVKSKEAVGKGDVICVTAVALCFTFNNVFSLMIYTLLTCLAFGLIQVAIKKINAKQGMPFVPFIVLGIFLTIIFI